MQHASVPGTIPTWSLPIRAKPWWGREITFSSGTLLVGIVLLALALRLALLGQNSLWFDEAFVAYVAHKGWSSIPPFLRLVDAHPPFYYLLAKAWTQYAGTGEVALRIPSACFSTASVLLTYALARRIGSEQTAVLAALFTATAPLQIMSGQDARMYSLLGALSVASTLLLATSVEKGGVRWVAYASVTVLLAYTHYLGILVMVAQGLWVLCCQRRHLGAWALAAITVALVYLPWVPSLWFQLSDGHGWAWYRDRVSLASLADLAGLLAFGGTLFGMGNYFGDGTAAPLVEIALTLPFILLLLAGAWHLRSNRGRLMLIVLPLVVPVASVFAVSLVKPMFYARWFSFVGPFFSVLLALGIYAVGEAVRRWRDRVVAVLIVCVLGLQIPALGKYYLDPAARPYDWRAAAGIVQKYAHPGDFILYVSVESQIALSYYLGEPYPSLTINPIETVSRGDRRPVFTAVQARRLAAKHARVWVVTTAPVTPAMQRRLHAALDPVYWPVAHLGFGYVWVTLVQRRSTAARQ